MRHYLKTPLPKPITSEGTENTMPYVNELPQPSAKNTKARQNTERGVAVVPGYEELLNVLVRALDQAQFGKGNERHADGNPFTEQPMQQLIALYGQGFALGQAGKKMQESQRMERVAAVRELLGAIVYIAGSIIALECAPLE